MFLHSQVHIMEHWLYLEEVSSYELGSGALSEIKRGSGECPVILLSASCLLSLSLLVLLDYLGVREERQVYFERFLEELKYLLEMRREETGLLFLEYLSEFSYEELKRYEETIPNQYLLELDSS